MGTFVLFISFVYCSCVRLKIIDHFFKNIFEKIFHSVKNDCFSNLFSKFVRSVKKLTKSFRSNELKSSVFSFVLKNDFFSFLWIIHFVHPSFFFSEKHLFSQKMWELSKFLFVQKKTMTINVLILKTNFFQLWFLRKKEICACHTALKHIQW